VFHLFALMQKVEPKNKAALIAPRRQPGQRTSTTPPLLYLSPTSHHIA
jgi:hypothetical protein